MNEESLFTAALETPHADRPAFLDAACGGDVRMRRRIEVLLTADERHRGVLERGPDAAAVLGAIGPEFPLAADQLFAGRFALRHKLGEGGMGEVWAADQADPVRRRVALKVMRAGPGSARLLARFDAERQTLALMDHPNIGKVLDAGVADGRPYFVMEVIDGPPVTRYCANARLSARRRVELFVLVCQAVQHAHQKGVIHRDLKPSNILVAEVDGTPVPRVIDFGIAKAVGPRADTAAASTEVGMLVGTLDYMSPEQAHATDLDIDTRSDVYSLGALLYELLTGVVPFPRKQLHATALAETLRVLKEAEPPRPSTRQDPSSVVRHPSAFRELDWVVMKCLEKDRTRRYETADALAQDLRRYLVDEPVLAGPPSAGYRVRKFVRRNRGPVMAGAVVLLALLSGTVGTAAGLVEARRQRDDAEQAREREAEHRGVAVVNAAQAQLARDEARKLAKDEKAARDRAEAQLLRAEWLVYAGRITLAQQAWEGHNTVLAIRYLSLCRPDFRGWEHEYLSALVSSIPHTALRGHTQLIAAIAVGPDGRRVVGAGHDGTVTVWDAGTRKIVSSFRAHAVLVGGVGLTPDGRRVVTVGADGTVKVSEAATGREVLAFADPAGVSSAAVSPDGTRLVTGGTGTVKVWDLATGKNTLTIRGRFSDIGDLSVEAVALTADGQRVVSAGSDMVVTVWDAATGADVRSFRDTARIYGLAASADGKRIVTGNQHGTVRVWDGETGQNLLTWKGHSDSVTGVALTADGQRIVSGSDDMTVRVWDATTGQGLQVLKGHLGQVRAVTVTADGQRIVSGGQDTAIRIWDGNAADERPNIACPPEALVFDVAALSGDGKRIVTGCRDGRLMIWDTATGRESLTIKPKERGHHSIISLTFSPDGQRIVGSFDTHVRVWDADTGQVLRTLEGHTHGYIWVALLPDGKRILSASKDGTVRVWDEAGGVQTRPLEGYMRHPNPVRVHCLALNPGTGHVVGGWSDGTVQVWDAYTGQTVRRISGHQQIIYAVGMSRDGRRVVSASADLTARLWDAATGDELLVLRGHSNVVLQAAFMPDGRRVITGGFDKTVKVWDGATGQEVLTLKGDSPVIGSDGKRILYLSAERTLRTWDTTKTRPAGD